MDWESARFASALEADICTLPHTLRQRIVRAGDYLHAIPAACPDAHGLRMISPGVRLLRIGRNYIEPEHALAMALAPGGAHQCMELDDAQARRYLAGEVLPCSDALRSWTLITWNGMPLGWGKASSGQMKNHLPKGLRLSLHA